MYCIYCGANLEVDMDICPYCRNSLMNEIKDIEFGNKEKLEKLCPDINSIVSGGFMEYKYSFDSRYSRFINAYRFFEELFYINKTVFIENMVRIQNFDEDYAERLISLAMDGLGKTALLTEALFYRENIKGDYDKINGTYRDIIKRQFHEIEMELREMDRQKTQYDRNRAENYQENMEKNYKTRWVGGGFGIGGAIRGSLQASMLNVGSSMLTGTANTIGYIASNAIANSMDRQMRSERFNSHQFRFQIAGKYTAAMEEMLLWNCGKIDKELTTSLFKGELHKRAKAEIERLNDNMTDEEIIQKCFSVMSYNPYYLNLYICMYKQIERMTSETILSAASQFFGNLFDIKYAFMQADSVLIKKSKCSLDDSEQLSQKKFEDLRKLAKKNLGYCDFDLATADISCNYKDMFVRNWFQAIGYKIRDTVGYCDTRNISPVRWDYAETNAAYAYAAYCVYETLSKDYQHTRDRGKALLDENKNLQKQIQNGNKTAICIWAALHAKYAVSNKSPASKYTEVIWKLAAKRNALAMSVVGEWLDQGAADYPENKYAADMFFRMAMLQGNPYAIAQIGRYYKNGFAGYPKDNAFAEDLFNLAREVPLAKSKGVL